MLFCIWPYYPLFTLRMMPILAKRITSLVFLATNASVIALGIWSDIHRNVSAGNATMPTSLADIPSILAQLTYFIVGTLVIPSLIFQYTVNRSHSGMALT